MCWRACAGGLESQSLRVRERDMDSVRVRVRGRDTVCGRVLESRTIASH